MILNFLNVIGCFLLCWLFSLLFSLMENRVFVFVIVVAYAFVVTSRQLLLIPTSWEILTSLHIMAVSEEKLKSLLMRMKEGSEKAGLKFIIQKTKIMASSQVISWQIHGGKVEIVTLYFPGLQNHCGWWWQPGN